MAENKDNTNIWGLKNHLRNVYYDDIAKTINQKDDDDDDDFGTF